MVGVALFNLLPEALDLGAGRISNGALASVVALGFLAYLTVDRALLIASGEGSGHRGHLGAGSLGAGLIFIVVRSAGGG